MSETLEQAWFRRARRIALVLVLIVGGLGLAFFAIANQSPKVTTKIGEVVVDHQLSFIVEEVECGLRVVETVTFTAEATGQFCKVSVSVENVGSEQEILWADEQILFDTGGIQYEANESMVDESEQALTWMKRIDVGQTFEAYFLFDVPKNVSPEKILLQAPLSAGVEVSLKK